MTQGLALAARSAFPGRIVHYYPRALVGDGGATLSMRGLARAVAALGVEVRVLCDSGSACEEEGVQYVPVPHVGRGRSRRPAALEGYLRDGDLLVLHSGWVLHNAWAARSARSKGVPYVVTPHGAYAPRVVARSAFAKNLWKLAFERTLLECSTAVHVSFEAEVAHLRTFGYRGPAIVVPHGIDVPAEAQWDGGSGGYLLWLGRFDIQHKGLDLLIQALAMMPAAGRPEVRLHGTGSARQMHEVKRLVAGHDMERWVQLCPPVYGKDKWAALRTARAFVYPSRWDSHSVAMMEAVAVGVPLITTRSTFIGQELADKSAALVVEPTPEALAAAMRTGLEPDAALFGERGHRLLESSYTWSVVARRFVDESIPLLRNGP